MKKPVRRKSVVLILVVIASYIAYRVVVSSREAATYPSLSVVRKLTKTFSERSIDDCLPPNWPPQKIYWFDYQNETEPPIIQSPWNVYGVRIDPAQLPLKIDGVEDPHAVGLIGCPWIDKEINYSEKDNSVIQYSRINGRSSGGDIIFVLYK